MSERNGKASRKLAGKDSRKSLGNNFPRKNKLAKATNATSKKPPKKNVQKATLFLQCNACKRENSGLGKVMAK